MHDEMSCFYSTEMCTETYLLHSWELQLCTKKYSISKFLVVAAIILCEVCSLIP